jgi:hypothetical protein
MPSDTPGPSDTLGPSDTRRPSLVPGPVRSGAAGAVPSVDANPCSRTGPAWSGQVHAVGPARAVGPAHAGLSSRCAPQARSTPSLGPLRLPPSRPLAPSRALRPAPQPRDVRRRSSHSASAPQPSSRHSRGSPLRIERRRHGWMLCASSPAVRPAHRVAGLRRGPCPEQSGGEHRSRRASASRTPRQRSRRFGSTQASVHSPRGRHVRIAGPDLLAGTSTALSRTTTFRRGVMRATRFRQRRTTPHRVHPSRKVKRGRYRVRYRPHSTCSVSPRRTSPCR